MTHTVFETLNSQGMVKLLPKIWPGYTNSQKKESAVSSVFTEAVYSLFNVHLSHLSNHRKVSSQRDFVSKTELTELGIEPGSAKTTTGQIIAS